MTQAPNKRFGGFEGKLLIVISLAMIASIGFMAWFSEPPGQSQAAENAKEPLTILVAGATGRQGGGNHSQITAGDADRALLKINVQRRLGSAF